MNISVIDPTADKRWDEFVLGHPRATIFHTSNWARVIQKSYGYKPCYLILEEDNRNIKGGLPLFLVNSLLTGKRLVSIPFTDRCDLLSEGEDAREVIREVKHLAIAKRAAYFELRIGDKKETDKDTLRLDYYKNFLVELGNDFSNVDHRISRRFRRYIRNICIPNLSVNIATDPDYMNAFYSLNLLTRKKHGVIPQPFTFFQNIFQEMIKPGHGFIMLVHLGDLAVCGGIFFTFKDVIYHKFTGSDIRYTRYRANHYMVWSALKYGCENGFENYDFGRTAPDNTGLMSFKRQWGAKEYDLSYYYWPVIKGLTSTRESSLKYRVASSIIRKSPAAVSRLAGRILYRHFG